jgi:hypothetical protein
MYQLISYYDEEGKSVHGSTIPGVISLIYLAKDFDDLINYITRQIEIGKIIELLPGGENFYDNWNYADNYDYDYDEDDEKFTINVLNYKDPNNNYGYSINKTDSYRFDVNGLDFDMHFSDFQHEMNFKSLQEVIDFLSEKRH